MHRLATLTGTGKAGIAPNPPHTGAGEHNPLTLGQQLRQMTVIARPVDRTRQLYYASTIPLLDRMHWLSSPVAMGHTCRALLPKRG